MFDRKKKTNNYSFWDGGNHLGGLYFYVYLGPIIRTTVNSKCEASSPDDFEFTRFDCSYLLYEKIKQTLIISLIKLVT